MDSDSDSISASCSKWTQLPLNAYLFILPGRENFLDSSKEHVNTIHFNIPKDLGQLLYCSPWDTHKHFMLLHPRHERDQFSF